MLQRFEPLLASTHYEPIKTTARTQRGVWFELMMPPRVIGNHAAFVMAMDAAIVHGKVEHVLIGADRVCVTFSKFGSARTFAASRRPGTIEMCSGYRTPGCIVP